MAQVQWLKLYIDIFDNEKIKKLLRWGLIFQSMDSIINFSREK